MGLWGPALSPSSSRHARMGLVYWTCRERHRTAQAAWGKTQMAMGRAMGPEQPDPQTAGLSGLGDPSETVPREMLELWASLPRR